MMDLHLTIKYATTAAIVVGVSELARRSTLLGALLASLPLTSLLAIVWLYLDTGETARVAGLAASIFWLVLPSLVLQVVLPALLRSGVAFWPSLAAALTSTIAAYWGMMKLLATLGISP